jgi:hypothetical protein
MFRTVNIDSENPFMDSFDFDMDKLGNDDYVLNWFKFNQTNYNAINETVDELKSSVPVIMTMKEEIAKIKNTEEYINETTKLARYNKSLNKVFKMFPMSAITWNVTKWQTILNEKQSTMDRLNSQVELIRNQTDKTEIFSLKKQCGNLYYEIASIKMIIDGPPAQPLTQKIKWLNNQINELITKHMTKPNGMKFEAVIIDKIKRSKTFFKTSEMAHVGYVTPNNSILSRSLAHTKHDIDAFYFETDDELYNGLPLMKLKKIFEIKHSKMNLLCDIQKIKNALREYLRMTNVIYFTIDDDGCFTVSSVNMPTETSQFVMTANSFQCLGTNAYDIITQHFIFMIGSEETTETTIKLPMIAPYQFKKIMSNKLLSNVSDIRAQLKECFLLNRQCLNILRIMSSNQNVVSVVT